MKGKEEEKGLGGGGSGKGKGVWESVKVPWKLEAARVKKKVHTCIVTVLRLSRRLCDVIAASVIRVLNIYVCR